MFVNNIIGQSPYSELLEVRFAVEPAQQEAAPAFLARSGGNTDLDLAPFITIGWQPPYDDGAADVLGYIVEMKSADTLVTTWDVVYDGTAQPEVLEFRF